MNSDDRDDALDDDDLEPEAELVALHLAAGRSHAAAALMVGRSAKWVQRRLRTDPVFRRRVHELKAARVEQAAAGLSVLLERAVEVVAHSLDFGSTSEQLRSAGMVFDRSRLFRGDADLVTELDELRNQIVELEALIDRRDTTVDEER